MNPEVKAYVLIVLVLSLPFCGLAQADETYLVWSTFLGGSSDDYSVDIAVDGAGCAYVTGSTNSGNFPTTAGAFDDVHNGEDDVFIAKFSPTGSALDYSTFLGGYNPDFGQSIAVDGVGNAYVTGLTGSADFPTTTEAFDQIYNGDPGDVFVAKLNLTGSYLDYATFLGGNSVEYGSDIAVDGSGSVFVTGDVY
jgi:hypothetical protein